jgi:hypothetical protein
MNQLEESLQEETNLVEFKPKKKKHHYEIIKYQKLIHLFNQPEYLIQLADLHLNVCSDMELFQYVQTVSNLPIDYPTGFYRDFGLSVIEKISRENPMLIASYGQGLLQGWLNEYHDIGFVMKEGNIYGALMFGINEPKHSGYINMMLRGNHTEKSRAGARITKLWHNGYLRYWHDKGYRFIFANSFTPKGKEFISHVGKRESPHIFFSRQTNRDVRFNNKYHWMFDYKWDLKKKFEVN